MTSLSDLGRMLIEVGENGRVLQEASAILDKWDEWRPGMPLYPESPTWTYRLKPKVTYYRVWKGATGLLINHSKEPFPSWDDWKIPSPYTGSILIHDFEIEE